MNKKKIIIEAVFFVLMTGLTIYYLISSGVFQSIGDIRNVSVFGILFIVFLVLLYAFMDAFIIYRSMNAIHPGAKFYDGPGTYMMGNLGSSVTPWKSAHFPMIVYYLKKRGYTTEDALDIMASNQIIYSLVLPILYGFFMVYALVNHSTVEIGEKNVPLFLISLVGVVTNIGYFTALMLMMYNEKFQNFVLKIEIWFLKLIRHLKDEDAFRSEKKLKMKVYKESIVRLKTHFLYYVPSFLAYIIFMLVCFGLPYIIYLVLSGNSFVLKDYLYCFMLCQAMSYVTNLIPVPGGIGAAEFSFLTVYEPFMGSFVNLAVLVYRTSTYVLLILIDFVFFSVFHIILLLKNRKKNAKDSTE